MLVKNFSPRIGEPETIQVPPVVGPERINKSSRLKRSQPGVFVEVQRAALDPRPAALVPLVDCDARTALAAAVAPT